MIRHRHNKSTFYYYYYIIFIHWSSLGSVAFFARSKKLLVRCSRLIKVYMMFLSMGRVGSNSDLCCVGQSNRVCSMLSASLEQCL